MFQQGVENNMESPEPFPFCSFSSSASSLHRKREREREQLWVCLSLAGFSVPKFNVYRDDVHGTV